MPTTTSAGPARFVHRLTLDDLVDVIGRGIEDFRAAPRFGLAFGLLYAAAGWLLVLLVWRLGLPWLAYPLAMGFALISPFAAVGTYAVSDQLHRGETPTWRSVWSAIRAAAGRDLRWMAFVVGFAMLLWIDLAVILFFAFVGLDGLSPGWLKTLLTTPSGLAFLFLGNLAGAAIALLVFSISAVSFPMLYDEDVDFVTAMMTSVRLVTSSPKPMVLWCGIIGLLMGLSLVTGFVGLVFVVPAIGHATWHLYVRAVKGAA